MLFNSVVFLLFFAVVLAVHRLPVRWTIKKINLLVASYAFYASWNPPFVLLLMLSTVVDWLVSWRVSRARSLLARRACFAVSLCVGLGLLATFKYGQFIIDNFVAVLAAVGIQYVPPPLSIVLPVGISFYTFQTLSYTFDVYRGRAQPCPSLLNYALYLSFFPQLVAGPIVRSSVLLPQVTEPRQATGAQFGWGLCLLTIGLFEKIVLADGLLGPFADVVYNNVAAAGQVDAWLGTIAFSGQIFFDFAGYSLCAIGTALCLGFTLPDNFRCPYAAVGFSDFWRRWHISLSTWLRDYLYIPLGGNRHSVPRTYVNLMLTMLIGGLWHGASWRFVVWGGLHGLYLVVERLLRPLFAERAWTARWYAQLPTALLTYLLVNIAWVFFRAQDFSAAATLVSAMVLGNDRHLTLETVRVAAVCAVALGMCGGQWLLRNTSLEAVWSRLPWVLRAVILTVLILLIVLAPGDERAFIYFQF